MSIVISEIKDRVGYVNLNHPEKRNALSPEMIAALKLSIGEYLQNSEVKIIVLRSTSQSFCAGADLAYLAKIRDNTREENVEDSNNLRELFDLIYNSDKIFISEVKGPALAGGCGLATICDFCFADPEATFGYTEAKIGFVPALVMVYLKNRISGIHLRELLLTGKIIQAEEAVEIGLANRLILAGDMEIEIHGFAVDLAASVSSASVGFIKTMLREIQGKDMKTALNYAAEMNADARKTDDCIRGINAFLNKEKISW